MNAQKTIKRLRGEADRIRMSLYLSQSIYEEFKDACGDISPSKMIEELMREFVDDLKVSKTKTPKSKKTSSKKN